MLPLPLLPMPPPLLPQLPLPPQLPMPQLPLPQLPLPPMPPPLLPQLPMPPPVPLLPMPPPLLPLLPMPPPLLPQLPLPQLPLHRLRTPVSSAPRQTIQAPAESFEGRDDAVCCPLLNVSPGRCHLQRRLRFVKRAKRGAKPKPRIARVRPEPFRNVERNAAE